MNTLPGCRALGVEMRFKQGSCLLFHGSSPSSAYSGVLNAVNIFVLDIGIADGKGGWMCTFQGFRLHSEEAHFGEDLAIKIKMISLLGNYLMEAKLLFIRV